MATLQRSIDAGGVGQSGYAAGRCSDPALQLELQPTPVAVSERLADEHLATELGTDERWVDRGCPAN
jgi:hypothetical protein